MYKNLRYKPDSNYAYNWNDADQKFNEVIERYSKKELRNPEEGHPINAPLKGEGYGGQPIFIDIIVKVMLTRVYVNIQDRKLLTAEKILDNAESLLKLLQNEENIQIVTNLEKRQECHFIHLEVLIK
jgi:hypothetical protein